MKTITVEEQLKELGLSYKLVTKGNYKAVCPFCKGGEKGEATFFIQRDRGLWNCKRINTCNKAGNIYGLRKALGLTPACLPSELMDYQKYKRPTSINKNGLSDKAKSFITARGFSESTIETFKIRSIAGDKGIIFPYLHNGQHVNNKSRTWDKDFMNSAGTRPTLYNKDGYYGRDLYITEGEFDCMALVQYGFQATSLPNGVSDMRWIETEFDWINNFEDVYLFFDNDEAGQKAIEAMVTRLGYNKVKIVRLPFKDANECLMKGVEREVIFNCIEVAERYSPPMYKDIGDFAQEMFDRLNNPDKYKGKSTGLRELDEAILGWRETEVTLWSGDSYSGKSTIMNQMIANVVRIHKDPCCIISLEMLPSNYLNKLATQYYMTTLKGDSKFFEKINGLKSYIKVVDTVNRLKPKDILELMEVSVKKHGTKHFAIDSLMKVEFDSKDEFNQVKKFIDDLCNFSKKFKCHIHIVAHSRKRENDSREPQASDILGTSAIRNLADNIIIMYRVQKSDKEKSLKPVQYDAKMIVKKCRETGVDEYIYLDFDKQIESFSYHDVQYNNRVFKREETNQVKWEK